MEIYCHFVDCPLCFDSGQKSFSIMEPGAQGPRHNRAALLTLQGQKREHQTLTVTVNCLSIQIDHLHKYNQTTPVNQTQAS